MSPTHNRKTSAITVTFNCPGKISGQICGKRISIHTKGDWKNVTCWNCGNHINLVRHPAPIKINCSQGIVTEFDVQADEEE